MNLRALCLGLGCLVASLGSARAQETNAGVLYLDLAGDEIQGPRGWPWPFLWYSLAPGPVSETLVVRSASGAGISVRAVAPGRWWLSPEQTLALPAGLTTARVGKVELLLETVDLPPTLTADQEEIRSLVRVRHALAVGQATDARRLAEAWVTANPDSPMARAALAETIAAQGQKAEALAAFQAALDRVFWGARPPENLLRAVHATWDDVMAALPLAPSDPPEEPEPRTLEEQDRIYGQDPNGQWAATATASSEYQTRGDYSASRATGPPDVTRYGDSRSAWASRTADGQPEWLEATFARAVHATAVRVRQVYNVGAISRVELFDAAGNATPVFAGTDTNAYPANQIAWFVVKFPRTPQPVQRARISLDSPRVRGWNEIDAVQLVAAPSLPVESPRLAYTWQSETGTLEIGQWPDGFVLQRATRLAPPDWRLHAERPPVRIATTGEPAYFRLVQSP